MTKAAPLLALLLLAACTSTPPPAAPAPTPAPPVKPAANPAFQALFPANAPIEKLASGFQFIEGPLWLPGDRLLFSDIPANVVNQWSAADNSVKEFLRPSENANGLLAGPGNSLILCQHSGRRLAMRSASGVITTLTDRFEGRKLNSPNDAVYHSDGSLYFTDPPYGLDQQDDDPAKELAFNGVYRLAKGKLQLLAKDLSRPNGIAFSPDEKLLYVANSDPARKLWMRYPVLPDGSLGPGRVFADVTAEKADGLPDGLKVDEKGNLWATGPGGVWVFSPDGQHLGTLQPAEVPANLAFGGPDGKTLFMTARTSLYRIATAVAGKKAVY
jgi:gluconolactonase